MDKSIEPHHSVLENSLGNPDDEYTGFTVNGKASPFVEKRDVVIAEDKNSFTQPAIIPLTKRENTSKSAFMVGTGILLSRIIGLVRQRLFAHYLGISDAAGAFNAAFKIPNLLQNVFGEGALSASFIPVYAKLLDQGDEKEATRVANAVLTLLATITSIVVLVGIIATPFITSLIAPGFVGETRELTIKLIRIFFPAAGLWCCPLGASVF